MGLFNIGMFREFLVIKSIKEEIQPAREIDYFTLLLLAGLFVVIAGITHAGVVDEIARLFVRISGNNLFIIYTL